MSSEDSWGPSGVVDDPVRLTAVHEAGHAVMAELCGQQVTEVEVEGDDRHTGSVRSLRFVEEHPEEVDPHLPTAPLERRLLCTVAGMVAEAMASGRDGWDDGSEDLDAAVRLAIQVVGDCERVIPFLETARAHAEDLLRRHWTAVEILADALVARGRLSGEEVRRLTAGALPD